VFLSLSVGVSYGSNRTSLALIACRRRSVKHLLGGPWPLFLTDLLLMLELVLSPNTQSIMANQVSLMSYFPCVNQCPAKTREITGAAPVISVATVQGAQPDLASVTAFKSGGCPYASHPPLIIIVPQGAVTAAADPDMTANPGSASKTTTIFENQNVPHGHASHERASDGRVSHGRVSHGDTLHRHASHKRVSYSLHCRHLVQPLGNDL
jgi:hypothetical protein